MRTGGEFNRLTQQWDALLSLSAACLEERANEMSLGVSPCRKPNMLEQQLLPVSCNDEASAPVLICLLGHFLLLKTGREVALRRGGKGEALLGHLSLQNRHRLPRAALLQMLWPTSDATLASQALNSLVYSLNQRIGDALGGSGPVIHEEGDYRLNVEAGVAVDVARFDALVRTGDQQGGWAPWPRRAIPTMARSASTAAISASIPTSMPSSNASACGRAI